MLIDIYCNDHAFREKTEWRLKNLESGGGGGTEKDPVFTAWKTGDYDLFKPAITNRVTELENNSANYPTQTQVNNQLTDLQTQIAGLYFNKSEITQMLGDIQAQALTQDQINQIIAALPDVEYVSPDTLTAAVSSALTSANGYTDTQISNIKNELTATINAISNKLSNHMTTDRFRWQDSYEGERQSIIRDANSAGLALDQTSYKEISAITVNNQFTADGSDILLGIVMINNNNNYCTVTINGTLIYTTEGLTEGVPVTKWYWLKNGDVIITTNADTFISTNFIVDNNSSIVLLSKQLEATQLRLSDLEAGVQGKTLDTANAEIIESQAQGDGYTVTNTLGGRVHYTGLNVVITTWALYVNGIAVRNGNLVNLGTTQGDYDVNNGDVITAIGMTEMTFTPYKAG